MASIFGMNAAEINNGLWTLKQEFIYMCTYQLLDYSEESMLNSCHDSPHLSRCHRSILYSRLQHSHARYSILPPQLCFRLFGTHLDALHHRDAHLQCLVVAEVR